MTVLGGLVNRLFTASKEPVVEQGQSFKPAKRDFHTIEQVIRTERIKNRSHDQYQ